jgi:hypothetical protein
VNNKSDVANAIELIGEAFFQLAFALRAEKAQDETPPTPIGAKRRKKVKEPEVEEPEVEEPEVEEPEVEEPEVEEPEVEEPEEVKLADLQAIGAEMIKSGSRSKFLKVLADRGLKNLSSADLSEYGLLYRELIKARAGE